jgi:hypothetical protein
MRTQRPEVMEMAGTIVILVIVALALLVGVVGIALFNRLVTMRQQIEEAWSDIDVQLERRHDLVPNLVATVKGYAAHERGVFDEVARARAVAMAAPGPSPMSGHAPRAPSPVPCAPCSRSQRHTRSCGRWRSSTTFRRT